MVTEIFVSFFPPLTLHLEVKHSVLELLFHTSIPWNLLDQFWGFCLFVFDLIAPFRMGCTHRKQEPAHISKLPRSADTFSQFLHSSQHPKDFWCFKEVEVCRGSKAILPTGVVKCRIFCLLSYQEISQRYKSHLFDSRSLPPRCAESNTGVILPTYNGLQAKRAAAYTL